MQKRLGPKKKSAKAFISIKLISRVINNLYYVRNTKLIETMDCVYVHRWEIDLCVHKGICVTSTLVLRTYCTSLVCVNVIHVRNGIYKLK